MQESMIERICNLIEARNIKDKDFCSAIDISQSTFSTWKKLNRNPRAIYIKPIADFLGVSEAFLLTGEQEKQKISKTTTDLQISPELKELFDACKNATPEDIKLATEMLKRMTEGK